MQLHALRIDGFRRLRSVEVLFGDATFLIGPNNVGKSSIFAALDTLLSGKKRLVPAEYFSIIDEETGETKPVVDQVVIEAEFRDLPSDARNWRGFKGRIFEYTPKSEEDSGLSITYRKTYKFASDARIELKSLEREIDAKFDGCKTGQDYIDLGVDAIEVRELFPKLSAKIGRSKDARVKLEKLDEIWNVGDKDTWFENPGGIPGNVLKMLPRFLLIPADTSIAELEGKTSGVLGKTLGELFEMVREQSDNYQQAQGYLNALAAELDPEDAGSEFGKMLAELNEILASVFPESKLHARTDLSDPNRVLKPSFEVEMSSNVRTEVSLQGSGMIRAAAFGMLRFRQMWLSDREDEHERTLIVCFEEPETYLHPSAANQMRDTIYELSGGSCQIAATTHSPFLIDLSRKPRQILNRMSHEGGKIRMHPFNVTEGFLKLAAEDKTHVKMLLAVDSHIARVFFTRNVVIVEGDTESILIRESLQLYPREQYLKILSEFEIVKARGKATIIGLVKYLRAMGIEPIVVHDRDEGTPGAKRFNAPIANAVGPDGQIVLMHENVEDVVGYEAPKNDKPLRAFTETTSWDDVGDLPEGWRIKLEEIFGDYLAQP